MLGDELLIDLELVVLPLNLRVLEVGDFVFEAHKFFFDGHHHLFLVDVPCDEVKFAELGDLVVELLNAEGLTFYHFVKVLHFGPNFVHQVWVHQPPEINFEFLVFSP